MTTLDITTEDASIHRSLILNPDSWVLKADELLAVVCRLSNGGSMSEIEAMLGAYAVEDLVKARIAQTQPERVRIELEDYICGKRRSFVLFSHNLCDLVKEASIPDLNTPDWQQFFMSLEQAARWSGRYPASTRPDGLRLKGAQEVEGYIVENCHNAADGLNLITACNYLKTMIERKADPPPGRDGVPAAHEE